MVCDVLIDMAKQALENEQKQNEELDKKGKYIFLFVCLFQILNYFLFFLFKKKFACNLKRLDRVQIILKNIILIRNWEDVKNFILVVAIQMKITFIVYLNAKIHAIL